MPLSDQLSHIIYILLFEETSLIKSSLFKTSVLPHFCRMCVIDCILVSVFFPLFLFFFPYVYAINKHNLIAYFFFYL